MFQYSALNNRTYPTATQILSVLRQADNDTATGDPRPLAAVCKQMFIANLRLGGHQLVRRTAVSSFGYSITAIDSADAGKAADATTALKGAISELLENHTTTPFFGSSAFALEWAFVNNTWSPTAKPLDPTEVASYGSGVRIFDGNSEKLTVKATIESEFENDLYVIDNDGGFKAGGKLRAILPTDFIRYEIIRENANYLKKLKGILQVINRGGSDDDKEAAESAAADAASNNYVATSDLIEFKLNSITNGGAGFKEFIDSLNADISIAILGQANTSEVPASGGSRAALQVMKLVSADIHYDDIIRIERVINNQIILPYWKRNFDRNASQAGLVFNVNLFEEQNYESNIIVLREALAAGVPVLKSEAYQKIGYQAPPAGTPDDQLLKTPPPQF